ncbi:carbamoyl phosphate synthase small subunit [Metabacillus sp. RGM 3146]|uniref:carbamoyl phosphate synthase small subunit n=1 Tax=Metabacillus sp. RGM 3146 TaxID=3401092 RepID=UPI003B9D08F0
MEGYLILEDGTSFEGKISEHTSEEGEIVFYTGMTGYQEVLTDPSYTDQIIVFTYPLIGNYGINQYDFESKEPTVKGVVLYECCESFSHYKAVSSVREYLAKWNVPMLEHVDTRSVVKNIRENGTMKALISTSAEEKLSDLPITIRQHSAERGITAYGNGKRSIALIDFGYKKSIVTSLVKRDCSVTVIPYKEMEKVFSKKYDGVVFSNGPGDPKGHKNCLELIKKIADAYPTLGICLGHQLLALAYGGNTKKLRFGHRGANHPVYDLNSHMVFMTSQNHSYVVDAFEQKDFAVRFKNVNDETVEGLVHQKLPILSAQFHPEANPGPSDSEWILDEFLEMAEEKGVKKLYA